MRGVPLRSRSVVQVPLHLGLPVHRDRTADESLEVDPEWSSLMGKGYAVMHVTLAVHAVAQAGSS